jgi:hypothetical protein
MGFVARVCQPSTLRMLICSDASNAQNIIAAVSAEGSTVWVLMRRLNSSCSRSIALVVRKLRHWLITPNISQETLAGMIGTTRSRVSEFMNKFRKLGLISYNGHIEVNSALLDAVLRDKPELKEDE